MTAPADTAQPAVQGRPRGISRLAVFILGVIVIPLLLNVALNNYGAHTAEGAVQMAFATVAGQTVTILSGITLVVLTVKRKYAIPAIIGTVVIAAAIAYGAVATMGGAAALLFTRLADIAEVDQLNR